MDKLFEVLKKIGVDWRDRRPIINLYIQQTEVVRTVNADSEPGEIRRKVRQGCLSSPLLFSKRRELFSKRLCKELKKRVIMTRVWSVALYKSETLFAKVLAIFKIMNKVLVVKHVYFRNFSAFSAPPSAPFEARQPNRIKLLDRCAKKCAEKFLSRHRSSH